MKASIITFGCRVNQAESLAMEQELRASGHEIVPAAAADVVFVNSCSVTATADQGTRQAIRRIARENTAVRIVVTGCYATRQAADVESLPNVTAVVPNQRKDGIVGRELKRLAPNAENVPASGTFEAVAAAGGCGISGTSGTATPILLLRPGMAGRTAFTLRVQTGCDEPCSYCIIPTTRGHGASSSVDDLLREVRAIEAAGYREVTLTGVHLGAYGRDRSDAVDLAVLLERLIRSTRDVVFRLGSLEPMDCTPAIIDLAADNPRLAPAFHLPLQHASDRVLRAMARPYAVSAYDAIVSTLRARVPHAAIGADVIVGFPGEHEDDVEQLLAYLRSSPLTGLHVFPYSDRPGTAASALPDKVPGPVVRERARQVRGIGEQLSRAFRDRQIGSIRPALTIEGGAAVLTDNGLRLPLAVPATPNEHVRVRVGGEVAAVV